MVALAWFGGGLTFLDFGGCDVHSGLNPIRVR